MSYPYRQGIDYGPRLGTLAIGYHMSEGGDGLVGFLGRKSGESLSAWRDRVNGVSCHVAILSDGTIWQMLGWERACGNLNPNDRAGEYGYYGGSYLRAVMGNHYTNPNAWSVSCELAGWRDKGPTDAQVRSAIAWGLQMRRMFPSIRGSFGHHDQSPKPCPGSTPNMKAIFAGIGGHGLFTSNPQEEPDVRFINASGIEVTSNRLLPVRDGSAWRTLDGVTAGSFRGDQKVPVIGRVDGRTGRYAVRIATGVTDIYDDGELRPTVVLVESNVALADLEVAPPPPAPDCSDAIAADRAKARITWG